MVFRQVGPRYWRCGRTQLWRQKPRLVMTTLACLSSFYLFSLWAGAWSFMAPPLLEHEVKDSVMATGPAQFPKGNPKLFFHQSTAHLAGSRARQLPWPQGVRTSTFIRWSLSATGLCAGPWSHLSSGRMRGCCWCKSKDRAGSPGGSASRSAARMVRIPAGILQTGSGANLPCRRSPHSVWKW